MSSVTVHVYSCKAVCKTRDWFISWTYGKLCHIFSSATLIPETVYRATLCVSAVFAVARCLSVCLSRSCILSRRLKILSNFFVGPVAPLLVFFDSRRRYPILRGTPSAGAQYTRRVGKVCDFRLKSPSIRHLRTVLMEALLIDTCNARRAPCILLNLPLRLAASR